MTISDFWLSVVASILASVLIAIAAKITLQRWKQLALGLGATTGIALIVAVIIFSGITVTNAVVSYRARSALQEKINVYTKGHYPDEYESGYRIEVAEIGQRPFLAFIYPKTDAYPTYHPWSNEFFASEMQRLLNDNGYPGKPAWGYQMKPMSREQVEKLLERKPGG